MSRVLFNGRLTNKDSKQKGRYKRHDPLYHKAKAAGYKARSVYKLEEIDLALKILKKNDLVLDLGAAPGSWAQYVSERLSEKGVYVGIDLLPFKASLACNSKFIQGDIFDFNKENILQTFSELAERDVKGLNLVISDMAPNTTGVRSVDQDRSMNLCEGALELAKSLLRPGGHFCVKIFEGGGVPEYIKECRKVFTDVKIRRPKGVRPGSIETYIVGLNKRKEE